MSSEKQIDTSPRAHTSASESNMSTHNVDDPVALVKAGTEWGVWSRRTEIFTNLSQVTAFKKSELPHALDRLELRLPMTQELAPLRDKLFTAVCVSEDYIPDYVGLKHIDLVRPMMLAAAREPSFVDFNDTGSFPTDMRPAPVRWLSRTAKQPDSTCWFWHIKQADLLTYNPNQERMAAVEHAAGAFVGPTVDNGDEETVESDTLRSASPTVV